MSARQLAGVAGVGLLVVAAAVLPGVAGRASQLDGGSGDLAAAELSLSPLPPAPVCPGPETLVVPDGAQPVAPPAPVGFRAVAVPSRAGDRFAAAPLAPAVPPGWTPEPLRDPGGVYGPGLALVAGGTTDRAGAWSAGADSPSTSPDAPVGGLQVTLARTGDLRGLSARTCAEAGTHAWLVGGGSGSGRRARLLLANPAPGPAVVDVRLHGPAGPLAAPGTSALVVPAHGERALLLDALAPGQDRFAVEVVARSGRVLPTLYDSRLDGLAPAGTDDLVASAAPATRQLIPGLALEAGAAGTEPAGAVQVLAPGREDAVVRVRLLGQDGVVRPEQALVTVPAGGVAELPLRGVPAGVYTADVTADVPVVAAALVRRPAARPGARAPSELAWAPSATPLRAATAVALPADEAIRSRIALSAAGSGGGRAELTTFGRDGSGTVRTVRLRPDRSTVLSVPSDARGVLLRAVEGEVVAALVLTAADPAGELVSVAGLVAPAPARQGPVRAVQDRRPGLSPVP